MSEKSIACLVPTRELIKRVVRGTTSIPCACGGYCDKVSCTAEECQEYGCGRDVPGAECCAVAFVCRVCSKRFAGRQDAPEMEDQ